MPCSDQSTTCAPAARLRQLARLSAVEADDGDVEVDAVAARVRVRDLAAVGRERAGDVDRIGIAGERELGATRVEAKSAWRSLPPASRAITQRSSLGEGRAAVTRSLPNVICSCRPSGATRQSCRRPVTSAR